MTPSLKRPRLADSVAIGKLEISVVCPPANRLDNCGEHEATGGRSFEVFADSFAILPAPTNTTSPAVWLSRKLFHLAFVAIATQNYADRAQYNLDCYRSTGVLDLAGPTC